jgi:SAM-dependent methyltransferase
MHNGRVLRGLAAGDLPVLERFLDLPLANRLMAERQLISTRKLNAEEWDALRQDETVACLLSQRQPAAVFEHPRIEFPSYPYEWPPEMLQAAAELTLDLAQRALADGFSLKDATPYNVLFDGPQPVFIDLLSFEPRRPGDPVWLPAAQFERTFLLPLLANTYWRVPLADIFLAHRDGLEPQALLPMCGPLRRWLPPFLGHITLPTLLSRKKQIRANIYKPRQLANAAQARFVLDSLFNRLRRAVRRLGPPANRPSVWSDYTDANSYNELTLRAKMDFVRNALVTGGARRVLDIGANTGQFSLLAAEAGAQVVAVDYDAECVGRIWRQARERKLPILPLVVDVSRPTPAVGWRNRECSSFLERAHGAFDTVLMLAVVHHLAITERVPLPEILGLAASLATRSLVIEWVGPQDPMFQTLLRGRDHLYTHLTQEAFEHACGNHFKIERKQPLEGLDRCLYLLIK